MRRYRAGDSTAGALAIPFTGPGSRLILGSGTAGLALAAWQDRSCAGGHVSGRGSGSRLELGPRPPPGNPVYDYLVNAKQVMPWSGTMIVGAYRQ
jgi:hypothetical protein